MHIEIERHEINIYVVSRMRWKSEICSVAQMKGIFFLRTKERQRESERIDGKYGNLTENQEMTHLVNVIKDNASKKTRNSRDTETRRKACMSLIHNKNTRKY